MSKILVIIGLIMMGLGFSRIASASESYSDDIVYTVEKDLVLKAGQQEIRISPTCSVGTVASKNDIILQKGATLVNVNSPQVSNKILQEIAAHLLFGAIGLSSLMDEYQSLEEIKDEAIQYGVLIQRSDAVLLQNTHGFGNLARSLIEEAGGQYDQDKIKTLKSLNEELLKVGVSLNLSAADIINNYQVASFLIKDQNSNNQFGISCRGINIGERLSEVLPFKFHAKKK